MQFRVVIRSVGMFLMVFSLTMLPPVLISLIYGENAEIPFVAAFFLTLITGLICWYPLRKHHRDLRLRDGFVVVVVFWVVLGACGSLPFILSPQAHMSITDAVFESMSGWTTTGATVIENLSVLPKAVLWYRQQLQWLGGMGIIVLAVAIMPMLGIGGMQLFRAETPGPMKDSKLTPRITETAKALWYIYLGLTAACAVAYVLAGMPLFDAVAHSFSTVAIGGFSTHDLSLGHYNSAAIELVASFFMLIAGFNFALHFLALRQRNIQPYRFDTELRAYLVVLGSVSAVSVFYLYSKQIYPEFSQALVHGIFQAISVGTTSGFTTVDRSGRESIMVAWPAFILALLIISSFIGGCANSTGGGMKVIRVLLLYRQGMREIMRLIHPSAVIPIKIGDKPLPDPIVNAIWGFFSLYVVTYSFTSLALLATGLNLVTAFSAVAACLNNLGPGLDAVASNYAGINDTAKWILCFAMLAGRLEIFTLVVFFSPAFWRR